jgi:hypothetical protein
MATLQDDLEKAIDAFNRAYGKHERDDAFELLLELDLSPAAEDIVEATINRVFDHDASAGFVRYDGIVSRLQVNVMRLNTGVPISI